MGQNYIFKLIQLINKKAIKYEKINKKRKKYYFYFKIRDDEIHIGKICWKLRRMYIKAWS